MELKIPVSEEWLQETAEKIVYESEIEGKSIHDWIETIITEHVWRDADDPPETDDPVLVWERFYSGKWECMRQGYNIGVYRNEHWYPDRGGYHGKPTVLRWMPLPEPPEVEVENG